MALFYGEPGGPYIFEGWPTSLEADVQQLFKDDVARQDSARKHNALRVLCRQGEPTEAPHFEVPFAVGHDVPLRMEGPMTFGPGFSLELNEGATQAQLTLFHPERAALAVANALRVCAAHRVLQKGGLMVHSAALLDDEGAHLFFGRSGDGKSTITRGHLARGNRALSDDLNVIWCGDILEAEALQRAGEMRPATPGRHGIRSLARLNKGPQSKRVPLAPTRAYAMLLAAVPFVGTLARAEERVAEILSRVLIETAIASLSDSETLLAGSFPKSDPPVNLVENAVEFAQ